jgi:tetratricopeptide (TPR) repeat protein
MAVDLSEAMERHRQGRLDRAAAIYEAALELEPDNPQALHLLGLVMLQMGNPGRAVVLCAKAVALRPGEASFHATLAEAHWALGDVDNAIACGRAAVALEPDNPELLSNLGSSVLSLGDLDSAVRYLRDAIRLAPSLGPAQSNLATALRRKGERAEALKHAREAVRLQGGSAAAQNNLGELLLEVGEVKAALDHCREAVRLAPSFAAAQHGLGNALLVSGLMWEAETCFREAIRLDPKSAAARASLADLLEQVGDFDGAQALLREVLGLDPNHVGALSRLATRLRDRLPDADRTRIAMLLANPRLPDDARSKLQFGLAHVHDAERHFDKAAALLAEANASARADFRRRGMAYDADDHRKHVDALIAAFNPEFFERVRGMGLDTERPVFVVGLPRSGTSLCEQILASHPQVFGAGELRIAGAIFRSIPDAVGKTGDPAAALSDLDAPAVGRLALSYLEALDALDRTSDRVVDKMPENTQYLGLIAALFPRAKVIYCRRDVRDVALSIWMTEFAQVRWACHIDDIAGRIREHRRLIDHWRQVLPVSMSEVDYEDIVGDHENTARRLIAGCGLNWNPACLEFHKTRRAVRTPSTVAVRQPIFSTSVGRWKNYERTVAELFARLEIVD